MTTGITNELKTPENDSVNLTWTDKIGHDAVFLKLKQNYFKLGMHPAALFAGREGIGKRSMIARYLGLAYCFKQNSCGECKGCRLLINAAHPDVFWLDLRESIIKKEDIESLLHHLSFKAQNLIPSLDDQNSGLNRNPLRSAVIINAQNLSVAAANRLLKILEEPASNACLLMSANGPEQILATLQSRLLHIAMGPPPREELLPWLITKFPFLAQKSKGELEFLMKSCSYSPGLLVKRCVGLDFSVETSHYTQESWQRVLEFLNAPNRSEALRAAQNLSVKDKMGTTTDAMVELIEQVLNTEYQQCWTQDHVSGNKELYVPSKLAEKKAETRADFLQRDKRRRILSEFKKQALQRKIAINQQYFLEKLALQRN